MKTLSNKLKISVAIISLCLASVERLTAQGKSSLKNLDLGKTESRYADKDSASEISELKKKLAAAEEAMSALQKNFGTVSSEAEVFRRKAFELNARLEAIGTGTVDDRLLKLLNELKLSTNENASVRDALIGLNEAVLRYQRNSVSNDPSAKLDLEVAIREAGKALGIGTAEATGAIPVPSTLIDGMVVSLKEDLALVVTNIGSRHGVKVGMPFEVIRDQAVIGTVRVVDVREKISGALIQNLSNKEKIKVRDRLKVAAQQ
jgi:hypothetical protein